MAKRQVSRRSARQGQRPVNLSDYETRQRLRHEIMTSVDNQIREENPPEAAATFERLVHVGYTRNEARRLIANALAVEYFAVLKQQEEFNLHRYVSNLHQLPRLPWNEELI